MPDTRSKNVLNLHDVPDNYEYRSNTIDPKLTTECTLADLRCLNNCCNDHNRWNKHKRDNCQDSVHKRHAVQVKLSKFEIIEWAFREADKC